MRNKNIFLALAILLILVFIVIKLSLVMPGYDSDKEKIVEIKNITNGLGKYYRENGYYPTLDMFYQLYPDADKILSRKYYNGYSSWEDVIDAGQAYNIFYDLEKVRDFAIGSPECVKYSFDVTCEKYAPHYEFRLNSRFDINDEGLCSKTVYKSVESGLQNPSRVCTLYLPPENRQLNLNPEIIRFINLKRLNLPGQMLTEIPDEVFQLKHLIALNLGYNNISQISPKIGNLEELQVLLIEKNPMLNTLPESLFKLKNLKKLYLPNTFIDDMKNSIKARLPNTVVEFY